MTEIGPGQAAVLWRILLPADAEGRGQRRAFPRSTLQLAIRYGLDALSETARTVNLSEDGMVFAGDKVYARGTVLHLELPLPDGAIVVKSLVTRCGDGLIAVQFLNLSLTSRLRLVEYCLSQVCRN